MEYKNKVIYPIDWYPNREEILKIQPIDLYKWFAYRSYGTETPGPEDKPIHRPEDKPIHLRVNAKWSFGTV